METKALRVMIPAWMAPVEELCNIGLKPDRLRVVTHQFFLAWMKNKIIQSNHQVNYVPDYFPVSSEILKEVGTKDYNRYVQILLAHKIIEPKFNAVGGRCYLPGEHAQLFRWCPPEDYTGEVVFRKEEITDRATIKSILRTRDKHQQLQFKSDEGKQVGGVFETLKDFVLDTTLTGNDDADALDEIHWFVVDEFGGRFHHRISTMKKEQRKLLRFKGHEETPLVTIDLKNSQPFFAALLANSNFIEKLLPEFKPVILLTESVSRKPDFLLYKQLCEEGRFYEFFLPMQESNPLFTTERNKIKTLIFRSAFYCRNRVYGGDKRFQLLFKSAFPNVFSFFSSVKKMNEPDLPELASIIKPTGKIFKYPGSNNSYKLLACMMQRAESRMMYQVIAPKLIEAGVKFITVHDSFMMLPEHVQLTKEVIKEGFKSVGLPVPILSVK